MRSIAEMGQIARQGDGMGRAKAPAVLLPRNERAQEGSEEITVWCPTCEERTVPMRNGTCGFCETPLVKPQPAEGDADPLDPDPPVTERVTQLAEGELRLGDDLLLPLEAATQSLAILAVKGAGKSNAAAVLAEEMFDEGIPWVVIDPKGDWWGIRETVSESYGLPALVLGGDHGDLPLFPSSGRAIAELIVERNLTCVLDVSAMDDEERPEFLAALGERLFELHRQSPSVRHVIVEEANEIVPQGGGPAMRKSVKAWTRIVCQGRQRGLGITLVSQRSALVHKNVLTQTGTLIVLRTTSPQDRAVIRSWVDFHSVGKELVDSLPGLANGEAWIVSPSWLGRVERVRLRRRWTFDSGATPEVLAMRRAQTLDETAIDEIGRFLYGDAAAAVDGELDIDSNSGEQADESRRREQIILELVAERPRRKGELRRAAGLTESQAQTLLRSMRDRGLLRMEGFTSAARWMLADAPPPEPPPDPVASVELARRVVETRRDHDDALEALDEVLSDPRDGLTLLRARYLAALLSRIEAGETSTELLDRFERIAGFHDGE